MKTFFFAAALGLITLFALQGGDPNITAKYAVGEVKSIDTTAKQLTIKTDAGNTVTVSLSDKTTYKKLAPGETTLTNASDVTLADLAEGDRVMARGTVSADQKTVPAAMVVVMTKGDLAKKADAERAEWGFTAAIDAIRQQNGWTRELAKAYRWYGKFLKRMGRAEAALEAFELAADLAPSNQDAMAPTPQSDVSSSAATSPQ